MAEVTEAAYLSSLADETPEGRSIVELAAQGLPGETRDRLDRVRAEGAGFVPFSAQTRMSGIDLPDGTAVRKGAADSVCRWVADQGGDVAAGVRAIVDVIAGAGGTPLVVAASTPGAGARVLGVVHLKDVVKPGMTERFAQLRAMGIRTVMITGDNPLTARSIAAEAGVDDFLAEATPEDKMALIMREQEGGRLVAMTGDGTNDAPALAQSDVGVAMNTGTSAAKEAANMVDLDSDPTKLIDIVAIGKQLLITRGALDDLLHRQRHREVLRDHPGDVRRALPRTRRPQRHGSVDPEVRHAVSRHLQCGHHHRADSLVAERSSLPPGRQHGPAYDATSCSTGSAASSRPSSASSSSTSS